MTTKADLQVRERYLEDVIDTLKQERSFAMSVQDWPRKKLVESRLKVANERLLTVSRQLVVLG